MKRGYPQKLVNRAIEKVAKKSRDKLLQYKHNRKENKRVPVIITHNPTHPPLSSWFKEGMNTTADICRKPFQSILQSEKEIPKTSEMFLCHQLFHLKPQQTLTLDALNAKLRDVCYVKTIL